MWELLCQYITKGSLVTSVRSCNVLLRQEKRDKISSHIYVPDGVRRHCTDCLYAFPHIYSLLVSPCLILFECCSHVLEVRHIFKEHISYSYVAILSSLLFTSIQNALSSLTICCLTALRTGGKEIFCLFRYFDW
jgi:hypothetical protein